MRYEKEEDEVNSEQIRRSQNGKRKAEIGKVRTESGERGAD